MKRPKSVALAAGGNFSSSLLAGFWSLPEMLGPVKASSFRLASRIANSLRAGHPVKVYSEFDACKLILISVPDRALGGVISELCSSKISWKEKSVVLCSGWRGSGDLRDFLARGASVASIAAIPGSPHLDYLIEGDRRAVQEAKRLVENRERRSLTIQRGLKPLYLAALTCTSSLLFPLVMAASESMRRAGVPPPHALGILEKQLTRCLRSYARAGRRAYAPPIDLETQLRALYAADPRLAHYVERSYALTEELLERRHPVRAAELHRRRSVGAD
jgi:hypothetical protein